MLPHRRRVRKPGAVDGELRIVPAGFKVGYLVAVAPANYLDIDAVEDAPEYLAKVSVIIDVKDDRTVHKVSPYPRRIGK
jgi:hypothetical protein